MQRTVTFPFSIVCSQFIATSKASLPFEPIENIESDRIIVGLVEALRRRGKEKTGILQCLL